MSYHVNRPEAGTITSSVVPVVKTEKPAVISPFGLISGYPEQESGIVFMAINRDQK
jgi:hypothetical protein